MEDELSVTFDSGAATAFILAGGLGTRLRPVLSGVQKVLAPVEGRPFVAVLLDQLIDCGVTQAVLCTGYLADGVSRALGSRHGNLQIFYSAEEEPWGTAGAVRLAWDRYPAETALVMNGDSFVKTRLAPFVEWYRDGGWECAVMLTRIEDAGRFGTVEVLADGSVRAFYEKRGVAEPGLINAGIYLFSKALISTVPREEPVSLERVTFPSWSRLNGPARRAFGAFEVDAPFIDIGTPESLAAAAAFLDCLEGGACRSDL